MESAPTWYLMKNDDGTIFGPITFEQLQEWASDAQVSPLDKVSNDEKTWMKAPMVPELGMDYLIEVSPDQFYGPTTLGAVREFLVIGEINADTPVTNCRDGSVTVIKEIPELNIAEVVDTTQQPVRTSIRVNLQQRVRELEETIMEERRAREQAEHLVERLEAKLNEITRAASL
ncbi:MAG TPA: GYF domain-containing protein [Chthoniobacter sp.]|nr:GYF domain-containing protein [Chthoniobacter sp.]